MKRGPIASDVEISYMLGVPSQAEKEFTQMLL